MQQTLEHQIVSKPSVKKERVGRWTPSESYLFQSLLEKYGKSWKKIHQHMKGRSLSQIRSHGQKYFDKIGAKKVEELTRRAKLLEAYETLEREKQIQEEASRPQTPEQTKPVLQIIKEQESPLTIEEESFPIKIQTELTPENKPSEIVKEQVKTPQIIKDQNSDKNEKEAQGYFTNQYNGGFLVNLIRMYPESFATYGIAGLVDNAQFRNHNHFFPMSFPHQ